MPALRLRSPQVRQPSAGPGPDLVLVRAWSLPDPAACGPFAPNKNCLNSTEQRTRKIVGKRPVRQDVCAPPRPPLAQGGPGARAPRLTVLGDGQKAHEAKAFYR